MQTTSNKLIVLPFKDEQNGLIIINNPTKPLRGRVIAVGPKAEVEGYKTGMAVMYHRFNNQEFEHDGQTFTVITTREVLEIL